MKIKYLEIIERARAQNSGKNRFLTVFYFVALLLCIILVSAYPDSGFVIGLAMASFVCVIADSKDFKLFSSRKKVTFSDLLEMLEDQVNKDPEALELRSKLRSGSKSIS